MKWRQFSHRTPTTPGSVSAGGDQLNESILSGFTTSRSSMAAMDNHISTRGALYSMFMGRLASCQALFKAWRYFVMLIVSVPKDRLVAIIDQLEQPVGHLEVPDGPVVVTIGHVLASFLHCGEEGNPVRL